MSHVYLAYTSIVLTGIFGLVIGLTIRKDIKRNREHNIEIKDSKDEMIREIRALESERISLAYRDEEYFVTGNANDHIHGFSLKGVRAGENAGDFTLHYVLNGGSKDV